MSKEDPKRPPAQEHPPAKPQGETINKPVNSSSRYKIIIESGLALDPNAKPTIAVGKDGSLTIDIGPLRAGDHTMDLRVPESSTTMPAPTSVTLTLSIKHKT